MLHRPRVSVVKHRGRGVPSAPSVPSARHLFCPGRPRRYCESTYRTVSSARYCIANCGLDNFCSVFLPPKIPDVSCNPATNGSCARKLLYTPKGTWWCRVVVGVCFGVITTVSCGNEKQQQWSWLVVGGWWTMWGARVLFPFVHTCHYLYIHARRTPSLIHTHTRCVKTCSEGVIFKIAAPCGIWAALSSPTIASG